MHKLVLTRGDLRQHPGQRQGEVGSVGTPEHRSTGSHKHAADLCEAQKTGLQAVDERVNSAIPRVFTSHSVVQHPLHPSDVVDTIGQPAHSRTDPLGHAATAADRDTQSARGLQAPKIADSSDNLHVFAPGSKEERRQQLPNTVYTIGQQENARTVASEQTAPVVNLATPPVNALHSKKIANIDVISRTFASVSKEEHPQQLPNTVYTTGQQENTRTVASEQTAPVVNLATPSVSALHSKKIANIDIISRTFAMDSKEECPQQLSDTVCSIGQQENTCAVASDHTA